MSLIILFEICAVVQNLIKGIAHKLWRLVVIVFVHCTYPQLTIFLWSYKLILWCKYIKQIKCLCSVASNVVILTKTHISYLVVLVVYPGRLSCDSSKKKRSAEYLNLMSKQPFVTTSITLSPFQFFIYMYNKKILVHILMEVACTQKMLCYYIIFLRYRIYTGIMQCLINWKLYLRQVINWLNISI